MIVPGIKLGILSLTDLIFDFMDNPSPETLAYLASIILKKFSPGFWNELGKQSANLLTSKVKELGQLVWENCFRGYQENIELLEEKSTISPEATQQLLLGITSILESNPSLKDEVIQLVQKIKDEHVVGQKNALNFEAEIRAKTISFNQGTNNITQNFG